MTDITMPRARYDALYAAVEASDLTEIQRLIDLTDEDNDVRRYILWVRWQNVGGEPPPVTHPGAWPPLVSQRIRLERPITRTDVEAVVAANAVGASASVHVTPDRNGAIGWSTLDSYFS